jgi:hypothetical protein
LSEDMRRDGKSNVEQTLESRTLLSFPDASCSRRAYVKSPNVAFHEAFVQRNFAGS